MADKEPELTEELEAARDEAEKLKQEKEAMAGELESRGCYHYRVGADGGQSSFLGNRIYPRPAG